MELLGSVKDYDWGKLGQGSFVARLAAANSDTFRPDDGHPYAELWMGDHVSGPSLVKDTGVPLGECIAERPEYGHRAGPLPFLFKVLSIRKALSIQVHPDKPEAEKLHRQFPDIYRDGNHKPELAIALTEFRAMCGFRPHDEIHRNLSRWDELRTLLGADAIDRLPTGGEQALRDVYGKLMKSADADIARCIDGIRVALQAEPDALSPDLRRTFLELYADFGTDVGLLSIFFLNLVRLQPGEAIFLPANLPHAYLAGDCIEVMACSDNVVRAGLTPKFKDVDTLLRLLDYSGAPADSRLFRPQCPDSCRRTFAPPVNDFAVTEIKVPAGTARYTLPNATSGSILLVVSGQGRLAAVGGKLQLGSIVALHPQLGPQLELEVDAAGGDFVAYHTTSGADP